MIKDETLFHQMVNGDMSAFDELYQRYERPLFGFIRKYVSDTAIAEDIFQESFMAVLDAGRKPVDIINFHAWIYRVSRNLCLNNIRRHKRAERALDTIAKDLSPQDHLALEGPSQHSEWFDKLQTALSQLSNPLNEMYAMRSSGLSYEQMASVLDIPIGTVKSRMSNMLGSLRKELKS